jgi:hypothetical protein
MTKAEKIVNQVTENRLLTHCEITGDYGYEYRIQNGKVSVKGSVEVNASKYGRIPVDFTKVTESFYCHGIHLTTLEGCPKIVGGDFDCSNNELTNLLHSPKSVGFEYFCDRNELKSLYGVPKNIDGTFLCDENNLKSLKYLPTGITQFICDNDMKKTDEYKWWMIKQRLLMENAVDPWYTGIPALSGH